MTTRKPFVAYLFWGALFLFVLFNVRHLLANPTQPGTNAPTSVLINELVASADRGLADEDGDFSDWIELYNPTAAPVDLQNWSLTDDPSQPSKWLLPALQLGSGQYLVIFASDKDRHHIKTQEADGEIQNLHTNFRLAAEGGFLALYPPTTRRQLDGSVITYPSQLPNVAYGVVSTAPDGQLTYGFF